VFSHLGLNLSFALAGIGALWAGAAGALTPATFADLPAISQWVRAHFFGTLCADFWFAQEQEAPFESWVWEESEDNFIQRPLPTQYADVTQHLGFAWIPHPGVPSFGDRLTESALGKGFAFNEARAIRAALSAGDHVSAWADLVEARLPPLSPLQGPSFPWGCTKRGGLDWEREYPLVYPDPADPTFGPTLTAAASAVRPDAYEALLEAAASPYAPARSWSLGVRQRCNVNSVIWQACTHYFTPEELAGGVDPAPGSFYFRPEGSAGDVGPAPAGTHAFARHMRARTGHVPSIDALFARPMPSEPVLLPYTDILWWEFRRGAWGDVFPEPTSSSRLILVPSLPHLSPLRPVARVRPPMAPLPSIAELFRPFVGPTAYGDELWAELSRRIQAHTPEGAPRHVYGDELWQNFSRGDWGHVLDRAPALDRIWGQYCRGDLGTAVPGASHLNQLWADFRRGPRRR
jgi:hypothetical protein